jgi:hypothetical protein
MLHVIRYEVYQPWPFLWLTITGRCRPAVHNPEINDDWSSMVWYTWEKNVRLS